MSFLLAIGIIMTVNGSCELYVSCKEPSKYKKLKISLSILTIVTGIACILINHFEK